MTEYKYGVFSLGLILLELATLEPVYGYNLDDEKIKKHLKNLIKKVK
jgi:hypothetical protein